MMKFNIAVLLMLALACELKAQERVVHGKITTLENIAVVKARIVVSKSGLETLSDSGGHFSITCNPGDHLKIYAHGFTTGKARISEKTKLVLVNLRLKPGVENREYAVGYGHVTDVSKLNAISNLNRNDADFSSYTSMAELIVTKFPGTEIRGTEIVIRHTGSMSSNNGALIILDGREVDFNTLNDVVPTDVKSINLVKDAGASVYGVRGADGVVIVETRRGGD